MLQNLSPAKNPVFKSGAQILCSTIKGNPNSGVSKGIVKFTSYDEDDKQNICFIELFAYQNPLKDWHGYEKSLKVFRSESSLTLD